MTTSDVQVVEAELKILFPTSFLAFLTTCGALYTPQLLDLVVDAQESGTSDFAGSEVAEFFAPAEIIETYRMYVSGGMDDSLVPYARDACGNVFGFRRAVRRQRQDDAAVFLFDHDFCEIRPEAESFDSWIQGFLRLKSV